MTPLAQLLEVLVLLLLFKGVLGYEFREENRFLCVGLVILFVRCSMLFILPEDYTYLIWRSILFPAAAMPFFFHGKWKINLAAGICMMQMVWVMYRLNMGIWIVAVKGDVIKVELPLCYYLGLAECLVALCVLSLILRRKKEGIFTHMELLNVWMFVPFFVCIWGINNTGWSFSTSTTGNIAEIVQGKNLIRDGFLGVLVLFIFILTCCMQSQRREMKRLLLLNQKCLAEQTEQYSRQSLMDEELRKFRHDYIKQITTLQQIAEGTDMDRVRVYLEQIAGEKIKSESFFLTNHLVCDAILNRYGDACRKQKMKISVEGKFPEHLHIPEVDLCVILTNGLQNAFEAASLCKEGEISVKVENRENFVTISIRNSTLQKPQRQGDGLATTKDDKRNHGIGTRNMADAARKSGGMVEWNLEEEGYVTANILIRGKKKE